MLFGTFFKINMVILMYRHFYQEKNDIFHNICAPQKKESTDLERHEGEHVMKMMTFIFLGELCIIGNHY